MGKFLLIILFTWTIILALENCKINFGIEKK